MRASAAAAMVGATNPGQTVTFPVAYDVPFGTAHIFVKYDTVSICAVKFDTGSGGLGSSPIAVTFKWRKYGNTSLITGLVSVGIRKASDDSFLLIAQWPVSDNPTATIGDTSIRTAVVAVLIVDGRKCFSLWRYSR